MRQEETTRICSRCGRELPIERFKKIAKGYRVVCDECEDAIKAEKKDATDKVEMLLQYGTLDEILHLVQHKNDDLAAYEPRQLLEEIKRRGYKWSHMTCTYTVTQEVDYNKI